eukprot:1684202-Amphidinium_carterae.1
MLNPRWACRSPQLLAWLTRASRVQRLASAAPRFGPCQSSHERAATRKLNWVEEQTHEHPGHPALHVVLVEPQ